MIIKSCYIENYGRLQNQTFHFDENLTIFNKENGWGKSTLASFLKAMLYGMEYKPNTKTLLDRSKYIPWHGGRYGGSLIVEIEGKEYKIERSF